MARVDQRRVTVTVSGLVGDVEHTVGPLVCDSKSGGSVVAETTKARPGGMADEVDYGGPVTVEDLELTAIYDLDGVHPNIGVLRALAGVQGAATVTEQPLDKDKNAKGQPDVFKGSVVSVGAPDYDANSTGDVGKLSLTVSVSGPVG